MSDEYINELCEHFLASSLPINSDLLSKAADKVVSLYVDRNDDVQISAEEVSDRYAEIWRLWSEGNRAPLKELKDVVATAISVEAGMEKLAKGYFKLEEKLESKAFMSRAHAIALIGCAPLIRTLVEEQRLGLDRIRSILNVPGATYDAIKMVLGAVGVKTPFSPDSIGDVSAKDIEDVTAYFGDILAEDSFGTFEELLSGFSRYEELCENVEELVLIGFDPYLFILYYELLTLETTDRFPGKAIYETVPRNNYVKALWNKLYHPTQENPYLNNAKSVYSLDEAWAETKLSNETQNGSLMLASIFEIMAEFPYSVRRKAAHVIRCFLLLNAQKNQEITPLKDADEANIATFVEGALLSNSKTKGVLDQRLVDFLTRIIHREEDWISRGLGSSVNETNTASRKYGDVEYLDITTRKKVYAYEAHGGALRDEYIEDHIHSLAATVEYHKKDANERGESYDRNVEVIYIAHNTKRLSKYGDSHEEIVGGIPFTFRFETFDALLDMAGGITKVSKEKMLYNELIHKRISRLPDAYALKQRYKILANL